MKGDTQIMKIIMDFTQMPYSTRHGNYGGMAGDKDGIIYQNEPWIIKYPKSGKFMQTGQVSYVSSPLSEYIGSHIFQILNIPVHKTQLGIRHNKIVVACKDFRPKGSILLELKQIKNAANAELSERLEQELHHSSAGDRVNLNELLLHLEHNPILTKVPDTTERFWQTAIVDVLIDNSDRNNGNWGILQKDEDTDEYKLAPVYDNGNAFSSKASDSQIQEYLNSSDLTNRLIGGRTAYDWNGKILSNKKLLYLPDKNLQKAILTVTPMIEANLQKIKQLIQDIPESYQNHTVCSKERKAFYIRGVQTRFDTLIKPRYNEILKEKQQNRIKSAEKLLNNITYPDKDIHQYD